MTLEDLERYDPHAPLAHLNRPFCCPFCGDGHPLDASHRSLKLHVETGRYICHRCGAKGRLEQPWQDRVFRKSRRQKSDTHWLDDDAPPEPGKEPEPKPVLTVYDGWKEKVKHLVPLTNTPGAAYLETRGLDPASCALSGVRFHSDWYGKPAVLFPIRDAGEQLVAVQGRYLGPNIPKAKTQGSARLGVFSTHYAWECDPVIFVEGPIDALSLYAAGYPAIAAMGCHLPDWVGERLAHRTVLIASDNDRPDARGISAGNVAGYRWGTQLREAGCEVLRLSPPEGSDWNDLLLAGKDALQEMLAELIDPWLTATRAVATMDAKVVVV
jgi:hypothetical protein